MMAMARSIDPVRAAAVRAEVFDAHARVRAIASLMANAITVVDYEAAAAQLDPACAHMAALQAMASLAGIALP